MVTVEERAEPVLAAGKGCETDLNDPVFQRQVNELRQLDNVRNWFYLAREWLFLAVVIGAALAFYHFHEDWGLSPFWAIPVTLAAVVLVGIGQHRLVMLGHEGSHFLLFKNQRLNEWASNWFCFFPVWSVAYNYRLQHMAHHQYTNDPERDPDFLYMQYSGQRFHYPMPPRTFVWECVVKLFLWIPGLIANVLIRAQMSSRGGTVDPYRPTRKASPCLALVHALYLVLLAGSLTAGILLEEGAFLLLAGPVALAAALALFTARAPEGWYMRTGVKPSITHRWNLFQRLMFITLLFVALAGMTYLTGHPWPLYYVALWLVPLGSVFSYLMLLREEIQHSNAPQGRFIDSRNFDGNLFLRWFLFPFNQSYHLPHHLFPLVPHYNLARLDELLRTREVYREQAVVVRARRDGEDAGPVCQRNGQSAIRP